MYSKTINLLIRLSKILSKKRKISLLKFIPLATFTGLTNVLAIALVSKVFVVIIQNENKPQIPFSELISTDNLTKLIIHVYQYYC